MWRCVVLTVDVHISPSNLLAVFFNPIEPLTSRLSAGEGHFVRHSAVAGYILLDTEVVLDSINALRNRIEAEFERDFEVFAIGITSWQFPPAFQENRRSQPLLQVSGEERVSPHGPTNSLNRIVILQALDISFEGRVAPSSRMSLHDSES